MLVGLNAFRLAMGWRWAGFELAVGFLSAIDLLSMAGYGMAMGWRLAGYWLAIGYLLEIHQRAIGYSVALGQNQYTLRESYTTMYQRYTWLQVILWTVVCLQYSSDWLTDLLTQSLTHQLCYPISPM